MTASLRRAVKKTALRALRGSGIYDLSRNSKKRSRQLLVLCYHGISLQDEHDWAPHLFVTADRFRHRLLMLRDLRANVLPLGEALQRMQSSTLPPRAVVITFDDGFYDFLQHATPILNEFYFPATLYLTTYYSGRRMPIVNLALNYTLWKSGQERVAFPEQGIYDPVPIRDWFDRVVAVQRLIAWCEEKRFTTDDKDHLARQLAGRLSINYDDLLRSRILQLMTPDEVARVHKSGIDIQLHTHRHRTPLDRDLFVREILDNRQRIAQITGDPATHFCYPSGNYDPAFFPWLRDCGVQSATTCERGFALRETDPFLLPRVLDDSNMEPIEFEGVVSGLFA